MLQPLNPETMKKVFYLLIAAVLLPLVLHSQDTDIRPVQFKKIKKEIRKKRSPHYYPVLFQRYLDLDTTLTVDDFRYLYYGFSFQDNYYPYSTPGLQDSLLSYLKRPEPMQAEMLVAARLAGELLKQNPFRLRETFIAALSYEMAGKPGLSAVYFDYYEKQVEAIMSSGDGLSAKTAFAVIYVYDEYEMIDVLGFAFGGGQQMSGHFDILELEENEYGAECLYFDVSRLLEAGFK